jgi:hypothetical protein
MPKHGLNKYINFDLNSIKFFSNEDAVEKILVLVGYILVK